MTGQCQGCTNAFEYEYAGVGRKRRWCDECLATPLSDRYAYARSHADKVTCACGTEFATKIGRTECRECRTNSREKTCEQCSNSFQPTPGSKGRFCSSECAYAFARNPEAVRETYRRKNRRRRMQSLDTRTEPYTTADIAKRDKYVCGICRNRVDMSLSGLDEMGPTIDHVFPLVRGGTDTPDNVQLAHRRCNSLKKDTVPA